MAEELSLAPLMSEVARLRASAHGASPQHQVLEQALRSLELSIEELQVASEELQVKNEELMLALAERDGERRRYRELFDHGVDGYIVTDANDVVVEANRAAGELACRPAESLIGCRLLSLFTAASRQDAVRVARLARTGQRGEAVLTLASGEPAGRLVQVRYRRLGEARTGQTHLTLTDLERPIFESEAPAEDDGMLARRWLGIYGELVAVTESLRDGARDRADAMSREARHHFLEIQLRPVEARLGRLRRRRDHWSQRHAELVGFELSTEASELRYGDRVVEVTRRERQLLRFLFERPGAFFPSRVLLVRAWQASYLSEEQVRTYVARLRRKLEYLELPCELVTRRPHGYALVFR
jgi:PAS domain S-box-containing protein